jgi:hypothetical protein
MPLKRGAGKRRHNHLTQQQKLHQHKYIQLVMNPGFAVLTDRRLKKCHRSELMVKGGQDHLTQKLSNNTASSKSRKNSYANLIWHSGLKISFVIENVWHYNC